MRTWKKGSVGGNVTVQDGPGRGFFWRSYTYLEGSIAGFEEEVGGSIDDDTVDFPRARAALDRQIGVLP